MTEPADDTLPPRTDRARYSHWAREVVRFADLDPLGHVNNNAIGVYFESARVAFFDDLGIFDGPPGLVRSGPGVVIVKLVIEFVKELHFPNALDIGSRMTRIGGSSFTFEAGLFVGETCYATSEQVVVLFDSQTRKSTKILPEQREILKRFL